MTNRKQSIGKFWSLKEFHIVKIDSLKPQHINAAAKNAHLDRKEIEHNTISNAVVKALGFKGGFGEYGKHYESSLKPFMLKHGLIKKADLFANQYRDCPVRIKSQNLSERLFLSGLPVPEKVFTGYNFEIEDIRFLGVEMKNFTVEDVESYINKVKNDKGQVEGWMYLKSVVLGCELTTINLLGDSLFYPMKIKPVVELYGKNENYVDSEKERHLACFTQFRKIIDSHKDGWIDIIPFNDSLIFLRNKNGEYDFVFKNQRDSQFEHEGFNGALKVADIPCYVEDYHFDRWHYFKYQGWRENDNHLSEIRLHKKDGDRDTILQDYLLDKGKYQPRNKSLKSNSLNNGFIKVKVEGKFLAISQLISIWELDNFIKENSSYISSRSGDDLAPVNCDDDKALPAAVTWYDALRYTKWLGEKLKSPIRLLSDSEFRSLKQHAPKPSNKKLAPADDLEFFDSNNNPIRTDWVGYKGKSHPPYMPESDFDKLVCKYKPSISKVTFKNNLEFYESEEFAEWVLEKKHVWTEELTSLINNDVDVYKYSQTALFSTGKYKHRKIGFRVCYLLEGDA